MILGAPPPARGGERERQTSVAHATEAYNAAAERHWASLAADPQARRNHLQKPFANPRETPAMALEALDIGVGHTVLDFGAGSCRSSLVLKVCARVPLRPDAGRSFAVDLVAEQICWFAHHGSRPLTFVLRA